MYKFLRLLKFSILALDDGGAGILALLIGLFSLKQGKKSSEKKVAKAKEEVVVSVAREQAAITQTQEVVQTFKEEHQQHEQTKEHIQEFIEVTEDNYQTLYDLGAFDDQ